MIRKSSKDLSVKAMYLEACRRKDDQQRQEYLREAVGDDENLRRRIERMLAAKECDQTSPLDAAVATLDSKGSSTESTAPRQIGPFKLLERLGEGGMGEVFVAQQRRPVQRHVALKLIKRGMETKDVLARFEAERQALAMMNHPNIASVLDVGQTDDGRPYFVMDLVRGFPITEYCAQHKLNLRERLELVVTVCRAVQHAHQKGVIHRDLKPSNVLVELDDVRHIPKVIDFGLAKATNQRLTEHTLYTRHSQMIGTPLYMSPEQAQLTSMDVDTRSDVYSLGVLLYELLTGSTPFDREILTKAGYDEMRRIIREDEPPRPSHRISTLSAKQRSTHCERSRENPQQIVRQVRGELDWIVMKAMDKDRVRRYQSASALAADVQRYLSGDLVQACPPSLGYRLRKNARRHRVAIVTTSLIAAALLMGTGVSVWQAVVAQTAQSVAEQAQTTAEQETEKAKQATAEAQANLASALSAIEKLLTHSSDPALIEIPKAQAIRKRILTDALAFYEQFKSDSGNSPNIRYRAAMTRVQLGGLLLDYRDWVGGEQILRQASEELEQLVKEFPTNVRYRVGFTEALGQHGRSANWSYLGDAEKLQRGAQQSMLSYQRRKEEFQRLADLDPAKGDTYQIKIIESEIEWARQMGRVGDSRQASQILERIRESLQRQSPTPDSLAYELLANATDARAQVLKLNDGDPHLVKDLYRESLELGRTMLKRRSGRKLREQQLRRMGGHFASYLLKHGNDDEIDEGQQCVAEAIELAAQLVREYPNVPQYFMHLHNNCGRMLAFLEHKLADARATGDDRSAEELSEQIAEFRITIAREYGVHRYLAEKQAKGPNNIGRLTESIQAYPDDFFYFHLRGDLYRGLGRRDLALADLNRAVELLPQHLLYPYHERKVHRSRGDLHAEMGAYEKAIADYNSELDLRPFIGQPGSWLGERSAYLLKRRGAAHFYLGNYDEALSDIGKALELNDQDLSALWWIPPSSVASCPDQEFREGVLALADRAVRSNEGSAQSLVARTNLLLEMGQFERVSDDLLAIKPGDADSYYSVYQAALVALKLNDRALYRDLCQKLLDSVDDSDKVIAQHFAAWTAALAPDSVNDYERAISLAEKAVEQDEADRQYRSGLGAIQMRAGFYKQALKSLEKSTEGEATTKTSSAYTAYFLAMSQHHLDQVEVARESFVNANQLAEQELQNETNPPAWNRKLTLQLLRTEAETLINGPAASKVDAHSSKASPQRRDD